MVKSHASNARTKLLSLSNHGWKLARIKCLFGYIVLNTVEFGQIRTGCRLSPLRNNYFCDQHHMHHLTFNVEGTIIPMNPFINFAAQINSPRETCNTLKSTTTYCEIKCKTRGILLVTSNCGIIISYREMFQTP